MEFFKGLIDRVSRPSVVCVQCHGPLNEEVYLTRTKDGFELFFCSQQCRYSYWGEYNRRSALEQGPRICRHPGCTKPCYQEGTKVHDYCGRTHAADHLAMMRSRGYHRQHSGNSQTSSSGSRNFPWRNTTGPIRFYNRGEPYYEFTNFYEAVVRIDNDDWLTTEHYFQAQKFVGTPLVGTIQMLERPREAFEKSRDPRYSKWRRSDWETVKEDVMYKALQAKFMQHEKLRRKLMETGDRELIEHSPHDSYWGDGGNGTGKNRLGELLMKLRREMKGKQPVQPPQPSPPSEPPKQPVTTGNSSSSNAPNKQPELGQQNKGLTGHPSSNITQHSPPSPPHDHHELVIANKAAGAQLSTNTGQKHNVIFTPSSTSTDSRTPQQNSSGSWQAKNDLSCSTPDTYQTRKGEITTSALTRNPLGSKPPGYPERVHSPPANVHSYADAVRGPQPPQFPPPMDIPTPQTQPSPHLHNNLGEGGPKLQSQNYLGSQSQPTNVPFSPSVETDHAQSSHPHNNLGEGGPQPQPQNNPEDEPMDTNE